MASPEGSVDGVEESLADRDALEDSARYPADLPPGAFDPEVERTIDRLLGMLTVEEKVGQLIVPALPARTIAIGSGRAARMIDEIRPGGVVLFGENIRSAEQVRVLVEDSQRRSQIPLFVVIDHEGGRVDRLARPTGTTRIPPAETIGSRGDPELAYTLGLLMARELRSLGINVNLAPVADVRSVRGNPVIGDRAYSNDPRVVGEMAAAMVRGLQEGGVSAALKHFPGHGATEGDSHRRPVSLPYNEQRLWAIEFAPFLAGVDAGSDLVLTGHIAVPAVTGNDDPATIAPDLIDGILREQIGFSGVVISDSLDMGAIRRAAPSDEIGVLALVAGVDLLLRPDDPWKTRDRLIAAIESGEITEERLDLSIRRILRLKFRRGLLSPAVGTNAGRIESVVVGPQRFTDRSVELGGVWNRPLGE